MGRRLIRVLGATAAMVAMSAVPAFAHVEVDPGEASASSRQTLTFTVGHDCDGSPTNRVVVRIGATATDVAPAEAGGWQFAVETDDEGATIVSWDKLDRSPEEVPPFEIEMTMPPTEGETLYLPVIQGCEQGEHAWIEIPAEGQDPADLESPAPSILLTAAEPGTTTTATPTTTTTAAETTTTAAATTTAAETTTTAAATTTTAPTTTAVDTTTTAATTTTTLSVAAADADAGGSAWPWVLAGVAALAVVGAGVWYARRDTTEGV